MRAKFSLYHLLLSSLMHCVARSWVLFGSIGLDWRRILRILRKRDVMTCNSVSLDQDTEKRRTIVSTVMDLLIS
jgi:hypothetical protein